MTITIMPGVESMPIDLSLLSEIEGEQHWASGTARDEGGQWTKGGGHLDSGIAAEDRDVRAEDLLDKDGDEDRQAKDLKRADVIGRALGAKTGEHQGVVLHFGASPALIDGISGGAFSFKADPKREEMARRAIDIMVKAGLPLPSRIGLAPKFAGGFPNTPAGSYNYETDVVKLRPGDDEEAMAIKNIAARWWSTGNMVHELSHAAHAKTGGGALWDDATLSVTDPGGAGVAARHRLLLTPSERMTARRVSRYAESDRLEFVAETLGGMLTGQSYDPDVMELYKKQGGPMPGAKK